MASAPTVYPVALLLQGRRCLVVGGGRVARRKVAGLLEAGARVTVVAPGIDPALRRLPVKVIERPYDPSDLAGCQLVICATGRAELDRRVHDDAEAAGIFVNAADDPRSCSFFLPAVHRDGPVTVAVSTSGEAPALAAALRDEIAARIAPRLGAVAEVLGATRRALHARGRSTEEVGWLELIAQLVAGARAGASLEELRKLARAYGAAEPEAARTSDGARSGSGDRGE